MDLKQTDKPIRAGTYKARVTVDNMAVDLAGRFELPVANWDDLREIVQQAILDSIKTFVTHAEFDHEAAQDKSK